MKSRKLNIVVIGLLLFVFIGGLAACISMAGLANAKHKKLEAGGSLPGNYNINGIDVSGQSILGAKNVIENTLGSRQVNLCGSNVNISEFTQINVELEPDDIEVYSYIMDSGSLQAETSYKVDKKKLKSIVKNIDCTKPKDARIEFAHGEAVIIPEVYGNTLKVTDKVVQELEKCLANGTEPDVSKFYKQPKIISEDLEKSFKKACKWNNYKLKLTTNGFSVKLPDISKHLLWNGKKAVVSEKWVKKKVKKLSGKLDTYGKIRNFITNSGNSINISGGTMGWQLNKEETEKIIRKAVKKRQKSAEFVWNNKGAVMWDSDKGNDIGDTYIEVSISQQKVWYYKNGDIVLESSTVTGLPTIERHTKTGVHHILYKQRDRILRGSAGAWNSFVSYWMPFTWDGQGLHDASWRNSFGGSIYTYNGSHGCVNLPVSFASQLYAQAETGTPVIVY